MTALAWAYASPAAHGEEAAAAKTPIVQVETAANIELADLMSYPARVVSRVKADVYAPTDGVVTKIAAPLGTRVRSGAKLLMIKNIDPVYEYVPVPVDTPVAGVVSAVAVTEGTKVTKGQPLVTVTDPRQIGLVIEVPAAEVAAFGNGLAGTFLLPMLGERQRPLAIRVSGVSPLVDPVTGTATVELILDAGSGTGPAGGIPPGVIGKVSFAINKRQGLQVPEQSVVYRGRATFVRTIVGGLARLVPVTVGETRKGLTEITSGVAPGAQIVVRASAFIADGQAVTVQAAPVVTR